MEDRNVQRSRAAQVGFVMRSYRESFSAGENQRGLTQEALLERMGSVDRDYAERYSHATVSRWESGGTRPTLQRLKVFGKALNLSRVEVAGLVLLAGLALDFQAALRQVVSNGSGLRISKEAKARRMPFPDIAVAPSAFETAMRVLLYRILPLGAWTVGAYSLSYFGWDSVWMPTAYVAMVTVVALALGFLLPDRSVPLREFYWVSIFFLLSTPLLQFAPIGLDYYNFYFFGEFAGTLIPFVLALLANLLLASAAGLMFQMQWNSQYASDENGKSSLMRAARVAVPPLALVYTVVAVMTNISVSIQMAVLLPALGAAFTLLLVARDPAFKPSERDRLFLLSAVSGVGMIAMVMGMVVILVIYLSPDLPSILPDHNLLRSWELNFAELGFTREEALDRLNLGYLLHATWAFAYMLFVVGGSLLVSVYRINGSRQVREVAASSA